MNSVQWYVGPLGRGRSDICCYAPNFNQLEPPSPPYKIPEGAKSAQQTDSLRETGKSRREKLQNKKRRVGLVGASGGLVQGGNTPPTKA